MITALKGAFLALCVSVCLAIITSWGSVHAAQTVPYKLNFQGQLADSSSTAMPNAQYNMRFRLYTAASGGTPVWTEAREAGSRVQLANGLFNVQLGEVSALSPSLFVGSRVYLEIELPTPATATCATAGCAVWSEGALSPRSPLDAHAYALNSDTLDGLDSDAFAQRSANNTFTGTATFRSTTNSTSAFAIQNNSGANLLVADTTNMQLKVGGGTISPDATPTLLVFDHKNTTNDPVGTNGAMYYNASSQKFRCHEAGVWKDCIGGGGTVRNKMVYRQDFRHSISRQNLNPFFDTSEVGYEDEFMSVYANFYNSGVVRMEYEDGRPGIWRFATGTRATGNAAYSSWLASGLGHSTPYSYGSGAVVFEAATKVTTLSDSTNLYVMTHGPAAATMTNGGNKGCFVRYSTAYNDGRWQGVCADDASAEAVCDTGATIAANEWNNVKVAINANATQAVFVVNDTFTCSLSTNIPSGQMAFNGGIIKRSGTTTRYMFMDFVQLSYEVSGR